MSKRPVELGAAELEVLKVLWDRGPCTVRQVLDALHEQGRRVAYTTVLTFLTRLEQKERVRSDKSGQAYVYKATVSRHEITGSRLKSLVKELYDGCAGPLVLQLVRSERLTREELAELSNLIDQLDRKEQTKKDRGTRRQS